jgi:hypothetical protein
VSEASREDFFRANPQGPALAGNPADQNFLRKQPKTTLANRLGKFKNIEYTLAKGGKMCGCRNGSRSSARLVKRVKAVQRSEAPNWLYKRWLKKLNRDCIGFMNLRSTIEILYVYCNSIVVATKVRIRRLKALK